MRCSSEQIDYTPMTGCWFAVVHNQQYENVSSRVGRERGIYSNSPCHLNGNECRGAVKLFSNTDEICLDASKIWFVQILQLVNGDATLISAAAMIFILALMHSHIKAWRNAVVKAPEWRTCLPTSRHLRFYLPRCPGFLTPTKCNGCEKKLCLLHRL